MDTDKAQTLPFPADSLLREGDLVFRRGRGVASRAVMMADGHGIYSHVGIVVRDGAGWKVVHVVPGEREPGETRDRIKTEALDMFFAPGRASQGAVMRTDDAGIAANAARRAAGIAGTGLLFDHNYDLEDTTRMYCTELIRNVFWKEGLDITAGRLSRIDLPGFGGDYILPGDIQHGGRVTTVYEF